MTELQIRKQLMKPQEIICLDDRSYTTYLVVALNLASRGIEIKATVTRKESKPIEKAN